MRSNFASLIRSQGLTRPAAQLGLLMIASALTEGIGLVLLVPLLLLLDPSVPSAQPPGLVTLLHWRQAPGFLLSLFVALVVLRGLINLARAMAGVRFETALAGRLRQNALDALVHCDWRELSIMKQTDNAGMLISDIDRIGAGVHYLQGVVGAAITLLGLGLAGLVLSPPAAIAAGLAGLTVGFLQRAGGHRSKAFGSSLSAAYGLAYGRVNEVLNSLRAIKSQGSESRAAGEVATAFDAITLLRNAMTWQSAARQLGLQVAGAGLLAFSAWLALTRWHVSLAVIIPLAALFARAVPLMGIMQESWLGWSQARAPLEAALALIARAEAAREPELTGADSPTFTDSITLTGVTVQFPGDRRPALESISLTVPADSLTVLTGPSGGGKSTLADLLGGLIGPDHGSLEIDGKPLDPELRRAWRRRVAYVQQDPVLLNATVRDNLRWGMPEASDAQLRTALTDAAAQFALELPLGLDTRLGDGGRILSGGERQRLVLARALLRDPALLILDEATSALDTENEALIAKAIARLGQRMAVVVIGHRGALLALADQTITLAAGRIVAIGDQAGAL